MKPCYARLALLLCLAGLYLAGITTFTSAQTAEGLRADLFSSQDARWLGVQPAGQPEQARVMLLSVPYALKAGDVQTLGGLPASAFMLSVLTASAQTSGLTAATPSSTSPSLSSDASTGGRIVTALPLFSAATKARPTVTQGALYASR